MAYKPRFKSKKLLILESLNIRTNLSEEDQKNYYSLKKGYEGEVMFDLLTEKLKLECYILNDLLLKVNNTTFQIDTLIIVSSMIHFFEVKNLEGDYFYDTKSNPERLYKKPETEYNNPLTQLTRSDSLLRQLLKNLGCSLPIEAQVVFINPEFTLYQAPLDKPFIFPTQVNSYLRKFDSTPSKLNAGHKILADKLISLHMEESPYTTLPAYKYEDCRKGITCGICNSFSITVHGKKCVCDDCGHEELVTAAVLRSVGEYTLLFPGRKVTTNIIYDWCGGTVESKKTIARVLDKNFKKVGVHQWVYYE